MTTPIELNAEATAPNSIQLTIVPKVRSEPKEEEHRFKIKQFGNASGTTSYRVDGYKRDGTRIRENFADSNKARTRQIELETEWLTGEARTEVQATKLSRQQIALAEAAFIRLGGDGDLPLAVEYWLAHGKKLSVAESPRLDDAFEQFEKWLEQTEALRQRSKDFLRTQVNIFKNSVPNLRIADITADVIDKFLDGRNVSAQTKINSRLAVSRFFSWCIERPRRWSAINPCREIRIEKNGNSSLPPILSVQECKKLMAAAERFKRGRLVPYVAACLFGGLRPAEVERLTWDKVNLVDGEIRIESQSTKTKKPRVVTIDKTLGAWLSEYDKKPFNPINRRRDIDALKKAAGYTGRMREQDKDKFKPWPPDVMRHTGISHFFRKTGSYGLAAEQFGNSEGIIKKHYQGRVSSEDTKKFYAIMPKKAGRK